MQDFGDIFESSRVYTIRRVLKSLVAAGFSPASILDYGCGEGRYLALLAELFPAAGLAGCDISETALKLAAGHQPHSRFVPMSNESIALPDQSFDFVISVEVLEHVQDANKAIQEISRVLKPGGILLLTTPCANKYSLEWFVNKWRGGFQPSADGYGRFATDEPGHLRRLNDDHFRELASRHGLAITRIYHRAHFFTTLVSRYESKLAMLPRSVRTQLALLDWHRFRRLPNGATMLALARKTDSGYAGLTNDGPRSKSASG